MLLSREEGWFGLAVRPGVTFPQSVTVRLSGGKTLRLCNFNSKYGLVSNKRQTLNIGLCDGDKGESIIS